MSTAGLASTHAVGGAGLSGSTSASYPTYTVNSTYQSTPSSYSYSGVNSNPYTSANITWGGAYSPTWSTGPSNYTITNSQLTPVMITQDGKINLKGEGADIVVNDNSLIDTLREIQERLLILVPNKELEEKWESLAELGRQYKELEKKLLERENLINILESD